MSKAYVHYGSEKFDMDKFLEIKDKGILCHGKNKFINKPDYGLWASPVDTDFGWKEFCTNEDFRTDRLSESFTLELSDDAKVFTVTKLDDIPSNYISEIKARHGAELHNLNFDRIMEDYDAMELIHSKGRYNELHYSLFYSWDVDSIVIWNPQIIRTNL